MWNLFLKLFLRQSKPKTTCPSKMFKVYLIRHGQSLWNQTNQFTGWADVPLSDRGIEDAHRAAKVILEARIKFDLVFTSVLERCIETVRIILHDTCQPKVPVCKSWRLNERHYGDLTGLNKVVIKEKYGKELVHKWRRGYDCAPPPLQEDNPYYCEILNSPVYANGPPKSEFPKTESLKDTIARVWPYWTEEICHAIINGQKVLVCAHGNSLRGIIKILDNLSSEEIITTDVPNATPFYYILDTDLKVVPNGSMKFLEDPETVKKAFDFLKKQSERKAETANSNE